MSYDDSENEDNKIVRFPMSDDRPPHHGPLINLPPATKIFVLILLGIHIALQLFFDSEQQYWIYDHFGFVAATYTGGHPFTAAALAAPFTYMLLHGSWPHVLINITMLMAFGAGVERALGAGRMLLFFTLCGLASVAVQFALGPHSMAPVIGASGGISGLFAAAMVLMYRSGIMPKGRFGLWPLVAVWVVTSAIFGYAGAPDGSAVAWAAHIGGFAAGFGLMPLFRKSVSF